MKKVNKILAPVDFSACSEGGGMIPTIDQILSRKIFSVAPGKSVAAAAKEMAKRETGSVLVAHEGRYIGIVTECDIVRKVVAKGFDPATVQAGSIMSFPIVAVAFDRPLTEANDLMRREKIRHLAITRNGKIIGMISTRDFLEPGDTEREASGF